MVAQNKSEKLLAIGWDVRGWRGSKQAVAVLEINDELKWWVSGDFQFQPGQALDLASLLTPALGNEYPKLLDAYDHVVIAIDAPLAFPVQFIKLLTDTRFHIQASAKEIDNPLAYRECERWIYQEYNRKPLSASFDKLGNGATLAMSFCHALMTEGFTCIPQQGEFTKRNIIEVYPGLHKVEAKRTAEAIMPLRTWLPENVAQGSDQYDACICALLAACSTACAERLSLPATVPFQKGYESKEGWVYSLPAAFVACHQE